MSSGDVNNKSEQFYQACLTIAAYLDIAFAALPKEDSAELERLAVKWRAGYRAHKKSLLESINKELDESTNR